MTLPDARLHHLDGHAPLALHDAQGDQGERAHCPRAQQKQENLPAQIIGERFGLGNAAEKIHVRMLKYFGQVLLHFPQSNPLFPAVKRVFAAKGCETKFFLRPSLAPEGRRKLVF